MELSQYQEVVISGNRYVNLRKAEELTGYKIVNKTMLIKIMH